MPKDPNDEDPEWEEYHSNYPRCAQCGEIITHKLGGLLCKRCKTQKENKMQTMWLKKLGACTEAIIYAKQFETLQQAWDACERGDWMLWLFKKCPETDCKRLVLAACRCARLSLKYVEKGEERPRIAIETAEGWARGEGPSLDDVRLAADADADAAAAAGDAAYVAAYVAAYAAADAAAAAADAAAASDAGDAAADAAAAGDAARCAILLECAKITRALFPLAPIVQSRMEG